MNPDVPGVVGTVDADGVIDAVPAELAGPRRAVEVITHYLEMKAAPTTPVGEPPPGAQVVRAVRPSVRFYRFLYDGVGGPWHWYARRVMPAPPRNSAAAHTKTSGTPTENVLKCERKPAQSRAAPAEAKIHPRRKWAQSSAAMPMPKSAWPKPLVRFEVQMV